MSSNKRANQVGTLRCEMCDGRFEPTRRQSAFVKKAKSNGDRPLVRCPDHGGGMRLEPATSSDEDMLRCPVSQCDGWVVHVSDRVFHGRPFRGCGECGSAWFDDEALFVAITKITEVFEYRRRCYRKTASGWEPAKNQPRDSHYDDLVHREPIEQPRTAARRSRTSEASEKKRRRR
ncbi:MAG: hypothetical protein ACAI25_11680 [Planctomycetota bacterium]